MVTYYIDMKLFNIYWFLSKLKKRLSFLLNAYNSVDKKYKLLLNKRLKKLKKNFSTKKLTLTSVFVYVSLWIVVLKI